jgi:hypothetical protein
MSRKTIIERHAGRIWCANRPEGGASVFLQPSSQRRRESGENEMKTLLFIDVEERLLRLYAREFESLG